MLSVRMRNLVTQTLLPVSWRRSKDHAATTLKRFSEVEFDSAWQYLNAMSHVDEPDVQLMLFKNLLEEMEHSEAFLKVSLKLSTHRTSTPSKARIALVHDAADISYFLAYAHESERSICAQFNGYAHACRHLTEAADVFRSIAIDEEKHEREARAALVSLIGSERTVNRLVWRVRFDKSLQAWLRVSRRIGDFLFALWVGIVFLIFGPLLRRYCIDRTGGSKVDRSRPGMNLSFDAAPSER